MAASESESPEKEPRTGSLLAMYAELLDGAGSMVAVTSAVQHHCLYLSEPIISQSGQPLFFFCQNNKSHLAALAQAAQTYLCALCTSVDSEQLFSTAGNIIDEKRNKLNNVEMLIFIKKNLSLMLKK